MTQEPPFVPEFPDSPEFPVGSSIQGDSYEIKAYHIAEKLKLKELKERFSGISLEFSNYEMVVEYGAYSLVFLYNYGAVVFFNVPEHLEKRILAELREAVGGFDPQSSQEVFRLELHPQSPIRVFFDRVVIGSLSGDAIKIVCMLLAESTALSYYEHLIEDLLVKTNAFSKTLRNKGKMVESTKTLTQFIGFCLDLKQEIISNLYIVDSPDETWESVMLDKLHQELKLMFEIAIRYRALEYKIKIIQESVDVFVDFAKSRREALLEIIIILLISFEIIISLMKWN